MGSLAAGAEQVSVAVASNFAATLRELADPFRQATGHDLRVSAGSTGKLYAQITQGAPFDLFLAADEGRPRRLVKSGHAVAASRITYAVGRLVLWSPAATPSGEGTRLLAAVPPPRVAIANPLTAPYGLAARETLQALGLWQRFASRLIRGENVGQAFQFVASGAVEAGFVSLAQVRTVGDARGLVWEVPLDFHSPLRQQAVLLTRALDKVAAGEFLAFLQSEAARSIIRRNGYLVEADPP